MTDAGALTVVVCTRSRGAGPLRTLLSVQAMQPAAAEVIVVDQSDDDATTTALAPLVEQGRIRYLRSAEVGVARARNLGLASSTCALVAFTDDDCEVEPDFAREMAAAFASDARIGLVFGSVIPAPHDSHLGIIPSYQPAASLLARTLLDLHHVGGMAACMALRREAMADLSPFDPCLGVGAPLRSAEETDLILRALARGIWVHVAPRARVVHHGFRPTAQSRRLVADYMYGTGAVFAKHLRLGLPHTSRLLARMARRFLWGRPVEHYRHDPQRRLRLFAFGRGFLAGMFRPLDRTVGQFAAQPSPRVEPVRAGGLGEAQGRRSPV